MKLIAGTLAAALCVACGNSIFSVLSENDSLESLQEDAVISMNENDYNTAAAKLSMVWAQKPTNEVCQLYAAAVLGQGQIVLFDVIRSTLQSLTGSDKLGTGVLDMLANSSEAVLGVLTPARLEKINASLAILENAPDANNVGVFFQKCITAGVSAVPTLQSLSRLEQELTNLQTIMTSFNADPEASCISPQRSQLDEAAASLTNLFSEATAATESIARISVILDQCFPTGGAASESTVLVERITALRSQADLGCALPDIGPLVVGSTNIPSCVYSQFSDQASTAVAGDGIIQGCELLFNCGGGSCF